MEDSTIVILAALFIALVMTFAQARLFSIDRTLQSILEELREANGKSTARTEAKIVGDLRIT